jgi:hypothetical protein
MKRTQCFIFFQVLYPVPVSKYYTNKNVGFIYLHENFSTFFQTTPFCSVDTVDAHLFKLIGQTKLFLKGRNTALVTIANSKCRSGL